ncbi:MAG: N-acetyltransferase family protein [Vicinamibacterales bacterium]
MASRSADGSSVIVRVARREDVPAVVRLLADDVLGAQRERVEDPVAPVYLRAFDDMAGQSGNELLVAVRDDEIVGCLQLTIIPGLSRAGMRRAQIEGVRVSARHRGAQVGERLVSEAIASARAAGCGLVQLTTDVTRADARRFYERLGFEATHLGMKLSLAAPPGRA